MIKDKAELQQIPLQTRLQVGQRDQTNDQFYNNGSLYSCTHSCTVITVVYNVYYKKPYDCRSFSTKQPVTGPACIEKHLS